MLAPQSKAMCMTCFSTQNHPSSRCVATETYARNPSSPSGAVSAATSGRHHAANGSRARTAFTTAISAPAHTVKMSASAVLRTVPAARARPAAVSHRWLTSATSAQTATAQNSASAYIMDSTVELGATAQTPTRSRLIRGSPVSFMPSVVSPHAATRPAAAVTSRPAVTMVITGSQAMESMTAGYPGNQENTEACASWPGG